MDTPRPEQVLRSLVPAASIFLVVVSGAVGGSVGTGVSALVAAGLVALVGVGFWWATLAVVRRRGPTGAVLLPRAPTAADPGPVLDLAAHWARVEPVWSGRRATGR